MWVKHLVMTHPPPPQVLRFSYGRGERETRVTGDETQGTMGRLQTAGEARCFLPAFLCAHIVIKRETSGYEAGNDLRIYLKQQYPRDITPVRLTFCKSSRAMRRNNDHTRLLMHQSNTGK